MRRLRDLMTSWSCLRYLAWRGTGSSQTFRAHLRSGGRLLLRPAPASDLSVANEVFVQRVYDLPYAVAAGSMRRIVDVGANVGYTCLQWLQSFPEAQVLAFEPHPIHVEMARRQIAENGLESRLDLVAAAAGVASGRARLSDAGNQSAVLNAEQCNGLDVPVVDFFEVMGSQEIDLLKIDIEGSEYPLLADPRFANLRVRYLVLEWHAAEEYPDGEEWCTRQLSRLGYATRQGERRDGFGLIWGMRATMVHAG